MNFTRSVTPTEYAALAEIVENNGFSADEMLRARERVRARLVEMGVLQEGSSHPLISSRGAGGSDPAPTHTCCDCSFHNVEIYGYCLDCGAYAVGCLGEAEAMGEIR